MTKSLLVLAAFCAALGIAAAHPAAAQSLAVGAVAPLPQPPSGEIRPVYVRPVLHSRWSPSAYGFREPIYTAPPGYVYRHIRGYTRLAAKPILRVAKRAAVKKRHVARAAIAKKRRAAPCVTDIGYGRYEYCG